MGDIDAMSDSSEDEKPLATTLSASAELDDGTQPKPARESGSKFIGRKIVSPKKK